MTRVRKYLKLIVFAVVVIGMAVFLFNYSKQTTTAYETSCPEEMSDQECLDYLEAQAEKINNEKGDIEQSLQDENYEQLSLTQQITYIQDKIQNLELEIADKEVSIEQKNVEIRVLGEEVLKIQNSIDTLTQEINILEKTAEQRAKESYKLTYLSPIDILITSQDLDSLLMQMKFIMEAREKDRELMADLNVSRNKLSDEEEILENKRSEIQVKRNEIENDLITLAEDRKELESSKEEQQVLLAESQRREAEYQAELDELAAIEANANQTIAQLIMRMYEEGQLGDGTRVEKGDYVGFQGHTGCSFGSHLHFSVNSGTSYSGWGYFWGDITPESYMTSTIPEAGRKITQGYHQGKAIDMVSTTEGNQLDNTYGSCWGGQPDKGQCYWVDPGDIPCAPSYSGWLPLQGEGAPVRNIMGGKVYYGTESWYGGKFAMVVHDNGYVSIYLHIR